MKFALLLLGAVGVFASRSSWSNHAKTFAGGLYPHQHMHEAIVKAFRGSTDQGEAFAETPEESDDFNQQVNIENIEVAGQKMPVSVELVLASVWCMMIALIPYILVRWGHKEVTQTQIVEGVLLLVWLVGGIVGFTQVILFESSHWEGVRSLTMCESTYLLTQILTTVGYGDITPAMPRGQVVLAIYILLTIILVANMFSQVVDVIQGHLAEAAAKRGDFMIGEATSKAHDRLDMSESDLLALGRVTEKPTTFEWCDAPQVDNSGPLIAFVIYAVMAIIGVLFFHFYPGEGKSWMEAVYMSIVTLSTVGFGSVTPATEAGKAFASFWMLIGVATLGNFCSECIEWSLKRKDVESYCPKKEFHKWSEVISDMDGDGSGRVGAREFLQFALVHAGVTTDEQIEKVNHFFRRMHPDTDGKVSVEAFQKLGAPKETPRSVERRSSRPELKAY